jgi:hypothetical protein
MTWLTVMLFAIVSVGGLAKWVLDWVDRYVFVGQGWRLRQPHWPASKHTQLIGYRSASFAQQPSSGPQAAMLAEQCCGHLRPTCCRLFPSFSAV